MKNEISISELVTMTIDDIHNRDRNYLFFDWFCLDSSLKDKAIELLKMLRSVCKANLIGKKFDPDKCYVFFKNNCPCYGDGELYDSLSICDIESGEVLFWMTPRNPYGKSELAFSGHGWKDENGNDEDSISFNTCHELYKFFKS